MFLLVLVCDLIPRFLITKTSSLYLFKISENNNTGVKLFYLFLMGFNFNGVFTLDSYPGTFIVGQLKPDQSHGDLPTRPALLI